MVSKATMYWRSIVSQMSSTTTIVPTTRRMFGTTAHFVGSKAQQQQLNANANANASSKWRGLMRGEFVPVYVALGLIILQFSIGFHTVKQQLVYSPTVRVSKKRREMLPEVEDPEYVVDEASKFLNKSFFRKVAHVQEVADKDPAVPDSIRKDVYAKDSWS
ncbi:Nfu1 iron-sulfur cluster protein [Thalictrum thalictroides]|uniref:Nfu1 iron-sulfur cluster protein n=1 Tax=Thalictrum thalictroides TaxID=46969 RepID=A0A7J6XG60_THATH|nr:Nfu1 iron-sulfur cluster protein [Thalictrum thalictroides]